LGDNVEDTGFSPITNSCTFQDSNPVSSGPPGTTTNLRQLPLLDTPGGKFDNAGIMAAIEFLARD